MPVSKYVTLPIEIEAIEFEGSCESFNHISQQFPTLVAGQIKGYPDSMYISTLEGEMKASKGDFIIKGLRGEYYPCKPDVFNKKYKRLE
jgi:hypothetical protein